MEGDDLVGPRKYAMLPKSKQKRNLYLELMSRKKDPPPKEKDTGFWRKATIRLPGTCA